MKLSERLEKELNRQVTMELGAAYIYKGMEQYFREENMTKYAAFFTDHIEEEIEHAEDFRDFIEDVGGHVEYGALDEVSTEFKSPRDVFEKAMEHEKKVSASIKGILEIAIEENHYAAENFLRTYIDEQVEEEDLFDTLLDLVIKSEEDIFATFELNKMLAKYEEEA